MTREGEGEREGLPCQIFFIVTCTSPANFYFITSESAAIVND